MAKQPPASENGQDDEIVEYEQELADYLQRRLKPGLNRGSIPLVARSIAREIATEEFPDLLEDYDDEADEDADEGDEGDEEEYDLETDLRRLQAKLGDDWVLYFSVHGDDTWLTAEKQDASQRVEAPTGRVLYRAVKVLNEGGGRSPR